MPANTITQDDLWCALYELGNELGDSDISPEVAAKLIELRIAERVYGSLQLTPYGEKCFAVIESGDGILTEFQ
jgi:hypothetical protein